MTYLRVKNWSEFQHYKDRNPPWIKLHRTLLDDYEFSRLQDASKAHLMLIWLFASQKDGLVPNDPAFLKKKLGLEKEPNLKLLISHGLLMPEQDASTTCLQDASKVRLETESYKASEKTAEEVVVLPEWLPQDAWHEWLKVRKQLKVPNTPRALNLALAELGRLRGLGHDSKALIEQSTLKGWKSFYPPKADAVQEPASRLCDYCGKLAHGSVNGYWYCGEKQHQLSAMDHVRPLGAVKVAA